ncbi:MAG TPA: hypothetical protein VFT99_22710, partial [Roseiflexaceae bacterium]|nr:hypothetical protein [Roseiflexaceae bacterium]
GIAEQLSPQGAFEYVASGQHDVEAVANRLDPGIHLFTYTITIDAAGQYRAPAPVVLGPGGNPIAIGIERSIAVRR